MPELEGHSVEHMYLQWFTGSVNKTIAAATNTYTSDFPDVKFRTPPLIR